MAGVVAADVEGSEENAENAETVEDIGATVEGEGVETMTVDHRAATRAPRHRKWVPQHTSSRPDEEQQAQVTTAPRARHLRSQQWSKWR
jgi:hypothetical protein